MFTKAWILRSIAVVQLVSALRILPQHKSFKGNSQEAADLNIIDTIADTVPVQDKRRSNFIEKILIESINPDLKLYSSPKDYGNRKSLRQPEETKDPVVSPPKAVKEHVDEQELTKMTRHTALKSELLGKPYVETRGRNDYLVIQSNNVDPFVTVIPNSIYYNVEKNCVNWLDSCSLKGIRAHLLHRVESPYK